MGLMTMRLNIGSGRLHVPGCVNMDLCPLADLPEASNHPAGPTMKELDGFLQADALRLPFRDGAFHHVQCGQLIEHLPLKALPEFIAGVARVLAPGGEFVAVFPDVKAVAMMAEAGETTAIAEKMDVVGPLADLTVLQILPYHVGHETILTGELVADLVRRELRVTSVAINRTNAVVMALKSWW